MIFLIIAALVLALGSSIYRQASRSTEAKAIEAGLIESGDMPTIYFNLKNTGAETANYTYLVKSNSTETLDNGLVMNVLPQQTFHYTLILHRPRQGAVTLTLEIFKGDRAPPIYSQTWLIKPSIQK